MNEFMNFKNFSLAYCRRVKSIKNAEMNEFGNSKNFSLAYCFRKQNAEIKNRQKQKTNEKKKTEKNRK